MQREGLVFFGISDLGGQFRGKGFPAADLAARLAKGVGLTGSNIMISPFGPIYDTPFGTEGDLIMMADPSTKVEVAFDGTAPEHFYIADILTTEGEPWSCCPRHFLRRGLQALREAAGLMVKSSFEQELLYTGVDPSPHTAYGHERFRNQGVFGEALMAAIRSAGATPDSFLPEYAPGQFEVTVAPAEGLRAADEAVIVREMARAVAFRLGHRVTLTPTADPSGAGSGTHVHFSLWDTAGQPATYDPARPHGLSELAEWFVAGIQHHLPALTAVTAPSAASYIRLRPNRWAPTWTNVAYRDRGAALRICPIFQGAAADAAHQYNVEFRVADASASPYMTLGALVWAGVDGIRHRRRLAPPPMSGFWDLSDEERRAAGFRLLPQSLEEAIRLLAENPAAPAWLGEPLFEAYLRFKRAEAKVVAGLSDEALCQRYREVY
jgi:glutamine synthetase